MMRMRTQQGLATVEFAIVAPLLVFLMLAVAEFGRAFVHYTVLANSARDAARYLASKALLGSTGLVEVSSSLRSETQNLSVYGNTGATGSPLLPSYSTSHVTVAEEAANNVSV